MMWTRKELKERAKELIKNNYWYYVLVTLVLMFLLGTGVVNGKVVFHSNEGAYVGINIFSFALFKLTGTFISVCSILGIFLKIFFINVIEVGGCKFFIESSLHDSSINVLFDGFKDNYKNIVYVMFICDLKLIGWTLLFIIPGIIKSYEYMMIPYLLSEDSSLNSSEVFKKTKDMMANNKWNTFVLELSFFGWAILTILTFDLASIFWFHPYQRATFAELYLCLKNL